MIISADTPEGRRAKIFLEDGTECSLPIKEYDTETQTALHYELDDNSLVKCTPWENTVEMKKSMGIRKPILKTTVLEGSYAEIDGKRV